MTSQQTHYKYMSNKKTTPVFAPDTKAVLVRGLNAMTKSCDVLSKQNEQLNKDIEGLKNKIARHQERVLVNENERE